MRQIKPAQGRQVVERSLVEDLDRVRSQVELRQRRKPLEGPGVDLCQEVERKVQRF